MVQVVRNTDRAERRAERKLAAGLACACVVVVGLAFATADAFAQQVRNPMASTEAEPLVQSPPRRSRPRIEVRPRYPYRSFHSIYPLPYDTEYPGPNAKRECAARYVQEARPSGTVVVPRVHCWWVGG